MLKHTRSIVAGLSDHVVTLQRSHRTQTLPAQRQNHVGGQTDADARLLTVVYWLLVPSAIRSLTLQYPGGRRRTVPRASRIRFQILQRLHGQCGAAQRTEIAANVLQGGQAAGRPTHKVLQMPMPMISDNAAQR